MEVILVLLLVVAVPVIVVGAKRGAEAAQRERERRWAEVPTRSAESIWAAAGIDPGGRAGPGRAGAGRTGIGERPRAPAVVSAATPAATPDAGAASPVTAASTVAPGTADGSAPRTLRSAAAARGGAAARSPAAAAASRAVRAGSQAAVRRAPSPIDINAATVEELQRLPGIGVRAAERIVSHRERHGDFASVDGLEAVEGFDRHRVSRLAASARV